MGPSKAGCVMRTLRITMSLMHPNLPASITPLKSSSSEVTLSFQRMQHRWCVVCPVMFASVPFIGEGTLLNLSQTGCRIECDRTLLKGSYIAIRLLLPDESRSLKIDLAAVRWIGGQCFGIEFLRIPSTDQTRLDQFLRTVPQAQQLLP